MQRNRVLFGYLGLLAFVLLVGCQVRHDSYTYGGKRYRSPDRPLKALQRDLDDILMNIQPGDDKYEGSAHVVLPSRQLIEAEGATYTGPKAKLSRNIIDYIVTAMEMNDDLMFAALRKRNIFGEVSMERSNRPELIARVGADYVIYKTFKSNQPQWHIKPRTVDSAVPIYTDMSLGTGEERVHSWLKDIEKVLASQPKK